MIRKKSNSLLTVTVDGDMLVHCEIPNDLAKRLVKLMRKESELIEVSDKTEYRFVKESE